MQLRNEVNYRLAKWLIGNMKRDGIISNTEMLKSWERLADRYNPPFLDIEEIEGEIGDGVSVRGK